jgi:hypothetical protein
MMREWFEARPRANQALHTLLSPYLTARYYRRRLYWWNLERKRQKQRLKDAKATLAKVQRETRR